MRSAIRSIHPTTLWKAWHSRGLVVGLALVLVLCAGPPPCAQTTSSRSSDLPIDQDPNDPKASKQEKLRRQRLWIQNKMKQRAERLAEEKRQLLEGKKKKSAKKQDKSSPGKQRAAKTSKDKTKPGPAEDETPNVEIPHVTFFIEPASQNTRPGREFKTTCKLLNPDHLVIDRIQVCLAYPTKQMQPVAIHQDAIKDNLRGEPEVFVKPEEGHLFYRAQLADPTDFGQVPLITIVWEALNPGGAVRIQPFFTDMYSAAYRGRKLLSQSVFGVENALAGATVRILEPNSEIPQGERFIAPTLEQLRLVLAGFKEQSNLSPPTLWIDQPAEGSFEPGQWLVVDIGLTNPQAMLFDEVRLAGRFDPEAVAVVDADRENWIHQGVNLLDGPFHSLWPWDMHYANAANNTTGYFYYRMGMSNLREQPDGPIARLFVRIKEPVDAPLFSWILNHEAPVHQPQTGVYLLGENVYLRGRETETAEAGAIEIEAAEIERALADVPASGSSTPAIPIDPKELKSTGTRENPGEIEKANPSWYRF